MKGGAYDVAHPSPHVVTFSRSAAVLFELPESIPEGFPGEISYLPENKEGLIPILQRPVGQSLVDDLDAITQKQKFKKTYLGMYVLYSQHSTLVTFMLTRGPSPRWSGRLRQVHPPPRGRGARTPPGLAGAVHQRRCVCVCVARVSFGSY